MTVGCKRLTNYLEVKEGHCDDINLFHGMGLRNCTDGLTHSLKLFDSILKGKIL